MELDTITGHKHAQQFSRSSQPQLLAARQTEEDTLFAATNITFSLSSGPAWSTEQVLNSQGYTEKLSQKPNQTI